MRTPKALSHSSVSLWGKDIEEFYIKYLAGTKTPRDRQENYMAVGASFDAFVKSEYAKILFGTVPPEFEFTTIFEKQVEPHNRDFCFAAGKHVYDSYVMTGAFHELLALLVTAKETPRFEFDVTGDINGVPFTGKPDCRFVTATGVHVILDWKVHGYCSKYGASPSKNYMMCRDAYGPPHKPSKSHLTAHKSFEAYDHNGFIINKHFMEEGNEEYANQTCAYGWLLGEKVGDEQVVVMVDEIVAKYMGPDTLPLLRVATHRARVSAAHQQAVVDRITDCWTAITTGHIFADRTREDSDARCKILEAKIATMQSDGTYEGDLYEKMARPQFRK